MDCPKCNKEMVWGILGTQHWHCVNCNNDVYPEDTEGITIKDKTVPELKDIALQPFLDDDVYNAVWELARRAARLEKAEELLKELNESMCGDCIVKKQSKPCICGDRELMTRVNTYLTESKG